MEIPRNDSGVLWELDGWPWQQYQMRYSAEVTVLFCIAYSAVFFVGFVGNISVVLVVYKNVRMRSSPTNIFIANLAVADLLVVVVCVPFTLIGSITTEWHLGLAICKIVPYFQGVSVNASINTLMAITAERCLSICHPMSPVGKGFCKRVVAVIWFISLTITMPWAIYFDLQPMEEGSDKQICLEVWPTAESGNVYFVVANCFLCYIIPLAVIGMCYKLIWKKVSCRKVPGEPMHNGANLVQRSKMKVIKMIMYVVVVFAVSWLPLYVAFSVIKFCHLSPAAEKCVIAVIPIAQWLGATNSSINPLLYAIFNQRFREGYRALMSGKLCRTLDYRNSMQYFGKAGTALKRKKNRKENNMRKTIGPIYLHGNGNKQCSGTANTAVTVAAAHARTATVDPEDMPPIKRPRSLSMKEVVHCTTEEYAGSVVQFCSKKYANSFV